MATLAFAAVPARQALAQCATTGTDQTCTNPAGTTVIDPGGWGINDSNSLNLTNFGTVMGTDYGVVTNNDTTVANSGTNSATTFGANTAGIWTFGIANVTNSGTIAGGNYGIIGFNGVTLVNSGNISGVQYGVNTNIDATVTNSGSISSSFIGISTGNDANVTNSGSVAGAFQAISAGNNANVINSGNMTGNFQGIAASNNANVINSGNIFGGTFGITANNSVTVVNSGTISSSDIAIYGPTSANVTNSGSIVGVGAIVAGGGSTLTNSGTIIGTSGIAIEFTGSADKMTFQPGSRVIGEIGLGTGDTINIHTGNDVAWLMTFGGGCGCGGGIVSTGSTVNFFGGGPYVMVGDQIATLDPTTFALADKSLMDFTGFISSLLGNRFGEFAFTGSTPTAFAPTYNGIVDGAIAAIGNALAYAGDSRMPNAMAADRASGIAVWSKGFVGGRHQDADGPNLSANILAYGGAVGLDKQFTAALRLGAFLGAGNGRLNVDSGSQTVKTDYAFGGVYGRYNWAAQFLDFAVTGGSMANNSNRSVADNINGMQTATASYNGWFVSPELATGIHIPQGANVVMTPTARLRYLAGGLDGYSETGSAQNLTVVSRVMQNVEERIELAFARTDPLRQGVLKTTATIGALGQERLGSATINTVLIGQPLSFAATGANNVAGGYLGLGFDYRMTQRINLFAAVEATVRSDLSQTGIAQGGLRIALD